MSDAEGISELIPYYSDNLVKLYNADCMDGLSHLSEESVHCCITSPPYWGLRVYDNISERIWGGRLDCEHVWREFDRPGKSSGRGSTVQESIKVAGELKGGFESTRQGFCFLCGAWRGSLGLEPIPFCKAILVGEPSCGVCYICHLVEVFRQIRRVLRTDGTVWLDMGDSYAGSTMQGGDQGSRCDGGKKRLAELRSDALHAIRPVSPLKPKDMCLIPQRLAIALQADGWYVRSEIVWAKPNPMPESVRDRPTKAHETIWLLTKSARYFYDQYALREAHTSGDPRPWGIERNRVLEYASKENVLRPPRKHDARGTGADGSALRYHSGNDLGHPDGRNLRDVWWMTTEPFPGRHFAVYPRELVRRCAAGGTSERGCCRKCGRQWERIIERGSTSLGRRVRDVKAGRLVSLDRRASQAELDAYSSVETIGAVRATGWQAVCSCDAGEPVPSLVLDPFAGSGTTLAVARDMGRRAVGFELSPEYCKLAVETRLHGQHSLEGVRGDEG